MSKLISLFCITAASLFLVFPAKAKPLCSYNTYKWSTKLKRAVDIKRVEKPYQDLKQHEVDQTTGCSICEQDQQLVRIPGIKPFRMCHTLANKVKTKLMELIDQGEKIETVIAYRPGMTRGKTDAEGKRTRFSNHSFGIALDINTHLNGLYTNCFSFGPKCRLIRGGPWKPDLAGTLTKESPIVQSMKNLGFKWGGEIQGRQKDFMHFSPTGY